MWRAYSVSAANSGKPLHARDRIGTGPWFNAQGLQMAATLDELHSSANGIGGRTSRDEHGNVVVADAHDVLTDPKPDGTLQMATRRAETGRYIEGRAMVGHSNKVGSIGGERARSWNSAHLSDGCTLPALRKLGSHGLLYCFAAD